MRKVLLDGALGTRLWELTGEKKPVWMFNRTHPDVVKQLIKSYAEAGSEIVQANSFTLSCLNSFKDVALYEEEMALAVQVAKEAASTAIELKIALCLGPIFSNDRGIQNWSKSQQEEFYTRMFEAGMQNHPDVIELETFMDVSMLSIATKVAKLFSVPVFASMSFGMDGKSIGGNDVDEVVKVISPLGVDAIGLNCSYGPESSLFVLKEFSKKTSLPLYFKPNNMKGNRVHDTYTPVEFAEAMKPATGLATYIGGCCGTDERYIKELNGMYHKKMLKINQS